MDEEKNEKLSRLSVMKDVFDNRVLFASYPSNTSVKVIFSGIEKEFLDFEKSYSINNNGKKPRIFIAGHSMGEIFSRMLARKDSEYIEKVGLIAGINDGLNFGAFTVFAQDEYGKYLKKSLMKSGKPYTSDNYQSINNVITKSDFLKELNTSTAPLGVEYNFYAFVSKKDNLFIPGLDDGVTSVNSALAIPLIKDGNFENVRIGEVIMFKGGGNVELDHFSVNNLTVLRKILESLKAEKENYSIELPSLKNATQIIVSIPSPLEEKIREKEKESMQEVLKR